MPTWNIQVEQTGHADHAPEDRPAAVTGESERTRQAINELRRISGLTWDQVGDLFGVSRRSVHFWASGKPLNSDNERRLLKMLDVLRRANRGDARAMRALIFEARQGTTTFELLKRGEFIEASVRLDAKSSEVQPGPARRELSEEAKAARKPLPPDALIEARHERVHIDRGRSRAARTVRNKSRGND